MKKEEKEIEQKLLSEVSLDELIKKKMEEEIKHEFEISKQKPQKNLITDITKVPPHLIFSKAAIYKIFNRLNKTQTFINGIQAEAMLGLQNSLRDKIRLGQIDAFSTQDAYVKFEGVEM
ncbi:MAG TPA: hypothetical protein PLG15_00140 [Candidatus Gastranaerophilaceae bacterium]|nr:hypothetical protein [Candidatus Gastranaerophilaceae bacterium]HPT40775.1 hypothetical protein [Candidatus Gastranaerophilaceae bacterium]